MASLEALWGPATRRLLQIAVTKTTHVVRAKVAVLARPLQHELQQFTARTTRGVARQPIHPAALVRQSKRNPRWFSTSSTTAAGRVVKRFLSSESHAPARFDRSKLPVSNTSRRVAQFSGRAPFANSLRPNLTGGALPRSAGGYSLGGGARYFSHTPAAPAQVVQNVSQAMRAFFLSGQKLRYDGVNARGDRQYRAVSPLEDEAMSKFSAVPACTSGSFIDFKLSPTVTALSPLAAALPFANQAEAAAVAPFTAGGASLGKEGFLDVLSADFARALKDLEAISSDLQRLAVLGDLPVALENGHTLRVRFPGVDAEAIERLCDDMGIRRGVVGQDDDFDAAAGAPMALMFPYAPDSVKSPLTPSLTMRSREDYRFDESSSFGDDDEFVREAFMEEMDSSNPWVSELESYEALSAPLSSGEQASEDYEGLEGIYRFLEECDRAQGMFR